MEVGKKKILNGFIGENNSEGFVTIAVKTGLSDGYTDIDSMDSRESMFKKADVDSSEINKILNKYCYGATHYAPTSLNGYTYIGPCFKYKNIDYKELIEELFKAAKDRIIIEIQNDNTYIICVYNKKKIIEYNKYLYELSSYLKNKYPNLYIDLKEKFLGIKHDKNDRYYILYLNQYKEYYEGFTLAIRGNVNNNKTEKQIIDFKKFWKYENGNRVFIYADFIENAIKNKNSIT